MFEWTGFAHNDGTIFNHFQSRSRVQRHRTVSLGSLFKRSTSGAIYSSRNTIVGEIGTADFWPYMLQVTMANYQAVQPVRLSSIVAVLQSRGLERFWRRNRFRLGFLRLVAADHSVNWILQNLCKLRQDSKTEPTSHAIAIEAKVAATSNKFIRILGLHTRSWNDGSVVVMGRSI